MLGFQPIIILILIVGLPKELLKNPKQRRPQFLEALSPNPQTTERPGEEGC